MAREPEKYSNDVEKHAFFIRLVPIFTDRDQFLLQSSRLCCISGCFVYAKDFVRTRILAFAALFSG